MAFFDSQRPWKKYIAGKVERYTDDTLSLIAREDSGWDWKQNEIKLISESQNQTEPWIGIHYFWVRKINL